MTKKEECFELFNGNDIKTREVVIDLAVRKLSILRATAQTYYSAWRCEYKKPGYVGYIKKEKSKDVTENADVITKTGNQELFEATRLIPVEMKGKYGSYKFDKDGVKVTANSDVINKEAMDEALEALTVWEKSYGGSNA